jgi:CheY-like chemotaxis protein
MILLVDDQADVRFMLSLFLEDEGVDFEEASSGEEALERTGARPYDLILLDQRMPPGLSRAMPIVLYSAYLDDQVERRAEQLGLRTVDKGEPDRLLATIRTALATG